MNVPGADGQSQVLGLVEASIIDAQARSPTKADRTAVSNPYAPPMPDEPNEVSAEQIAHWMLDQVEDRGGLYQHRAVRHIIREFGVEWSYVNANGNRAIDERILAAFRTLSEHDVIWNRGARAWRKRRAYHREGRLQD